MKKRTKFLTLAAACVIVVGGTTAFAFEGMGGRFGSGDDTSFFEELVEDGIITEDQLEEIEAKIETEKTEKQVSIYDELVEDGTLTDDEVEDIIEFMEEYREALQEKQEALREELEDMTDEERQAYRESQDEEERTSPVDEMVEEGIIDEDQAEAISELMRGGQGQNGSKGGMQGGMKGGRGVQSGDGAGEKGGRGM